MSGGPGADAGIRTPAAIAMDPRLAGGAGGAGTADRPDPAATGGGGGGGGGGGRGTSMTLTAYAPGDTPLNVN
jgi:hypothetical protein